MTSIKNNVKKTNTMTAIAETIIILAIFVTFMGYLAYKLAYEDGY